MVSAHATGDKGGGGGEKHTSSVEISSRISITSRAAWRLDANSTLGIMLGDGWGLESVETSSGFWFSLQDCTLLSTPPAPRVRSVYAND